MKLIYISLGIIFILLFFGQAWEIRRITTPEAYTQIITNSSGTFTVNGTESTLAYEGTNLIFGISVTEGILVSLVAIVAFGTAIGIKVLDSGISEFSQKIIFVSALYGGIWGIFSVLAYDLIMEIPTMGWFLFFVLTIIHFLGIFQIVNNEGK